jgi:hypothetical protein
LAHHDTDIKKIVMLLLILCLVLLAMELLNGDLAAQVLLANNRP